MTAQRRAEPVYTISPDESVRINIWRLWMAFMVPLNHVYSSGAILTGGGESVALVAPAWFTALQHMLITVMTRCVPCAFALISAVLLFRKPFDYRKNAVRKFKGLIVPLVLLTSFWIALYAIGPYVPGLRNLFSDYHSRVADWTFEQWFTAYFGWTSKHQMPTLLYPLWFMRDLMVMNLIAPAIKWIIDRFPRLFLCVLAVMLVMKLESEFYLNSVHQVFIFFCLGYYVVKYDLHLSDLDKIPGALIAGLYLLSIVGAYLARAHFADINAVRGIPNLLGVLFFARCCTKIPAGRFREKLLWLSSFNVTIYLFHERMLTFIKKVLIRLLPACFPTTLALCYLLPVIISTICISIGWFLHKYQPRFYSLITGTR